MPPAGRWRRRVALGLGLFLAFIIFWGFVTQIYEATGHGPTALVSAFLFALGGFILYRRALSDYLAPPADPDDKQPT